MKKSIKIVTIILLILIAISISIFFIFHKKTNNDKKVTNTIIMEINPSIKISLNESNFVLNIESLNSDGNKFLENNNFENMSLEKTINNIIDSLIEKKYVDKNQSILINISEENTEKDILEIIDKIIKEKKLDCNLIIQKISENAYELSKKYGITEIKASYIEDILKENSDITFEDLKDKTVDEINDFVTEFNKNKIEEQIEEQTEEDKKNEEEIRQMINEQQKKQETNNKISSYQANYRKDQEELKQMMVQYAGNESEINKIISSLKIVGVGDSVMLGAVDNLYRIFPNGYFDAKVSRSGWAAKEILSDLKNRGILGEPVIIGIGTNGDCTESVKNTMMQIIDGREAFWVTVTNDSTVHVNSKLYSYAARYNNLHIIDWQSISAGHSEYFYYDGIHLTPEGRRAYANAVYYAVYKVYAKKINDMLEEQKRQEEQEKKEEQIEEDNKTENEVTETEKSDQDDNENKEENSQQEEIEDDNKVEDEVVETEKPEQDDSEQQESEDQTEINL